MRKQAVICDIDGTLALHVARSPYDYARLDTDAPNWPVIDALRTLVAGSPSFIAVLLVSGRPDDYREPTRHWLARHAVAYHKLFMRPSGDFRPDTVIKRELYEREIQPWYEVRWVLDDRNRVVAMWRNELNLTCLQVADGDF